MFQVPLSIRYKISKNVSRAKAKEIRSYIYNDDLYVLFLSDNCLQLLLVPLLAQAKEQVFSLEIRPLAACLKYEDKVLLVVLTEKSCFTFYVDDCLLLKEETALRSLYRPEISISNGLTVIYTERRFYKLENKVLKEVKIAPYFSPVKYWSVVSAEFIAYSTKKHLYIYTLSSKLVLRLDLHGLFPFVSSGNIILVERSLIKVFRVKNSVLKSVCQIDINMEVNADWKHGEYLSELNVVFLSGFVDAQAIVYVDGYLFNTRHLITSFHFYRNCFFGLSKHILYFLPNDPDFDLEFTEAELKQINELSTAYVGRRYAMTHLKGESKLGHCLACIMNSGVRIGIRKMVLNEISNGVVCEKRLRLLVDFLRFDYKVYEVWMRRRVDPCMIYGQVSCMASDYEMDLELLMEMERLSFSEVMSNLGDYESEYFFLKGKYELKQGGDYIHSFVKSGYPVGKLLVESGQASDFVYFFKEGRLGSLEISDYEKIRSICFEKKREEICSGGYYNLAEEDVNRLLVFVYNCARGDVVQLVRYCSGMYSFLEDLDKAYHRSLEASVLEECTQNTNFIQSGIVLFSKLGLKLSLCKLKYMFLDSTGDKELLDELRELIGDKVFIFKKRFVGKELFETTTLGTRSYDKTIDENMIRLRNLRSGCVWTDVIEAEKWPDKFSEYKKELKRAERFYFCDSDRSSRIYD